ncbi:MAG: D-tyrosyl-tRNA(Tyr) deacylase [Acidobacteria bacterium]|nr:D-tyrosyl-tRNA(Tyr) deacylase [Acidobacteriota bacterium]
MRAVIQRVLRAEVRCGEDSAAIGPGLVVLLGVEAGDTPDTLRWAAAKVASLRLFEDSQGRMNLGFPEAGGEILAVSQFTLAGSIAKGRRPSFDGAMAPEPARELFELFVEALRAEGLPVQTGFFQQRMEVELVNDGPVTFVLER